MIYIDLFFTSIKINYDYKNALVCKYWYNNIIPHLKKKKIYFYDMQLYNAINNKYIYILYNENDNIILRAYNNIISNIMNEIKRDNEINSTIMENIIENYKKLSIIVVMFNSLDYYNTKLDSFNNIEKYIADEYAKILLKYYNYSIILT